MNLPHFQTPISLNPINHPQNRLFPPVRCYFRRQTPPKQSISSPQTTIPPRDRVIDFGKFKGKMLGTLPSTYLKWISKNLRARDFEEWANLADQVLQDPIYKDRIEWEFAENILNGNRSRALSSSSASAVSELLEISERFGWDNDDKSGWGGIDFELLGTSKGGRIPRVAERSEGEEEDEKMVVKEREGRLLEVTERRKERRERKMKKMKTKTKVNTREEGEITRLWRETEGRKREVKGEERGSFVNGIDRDGDGDGGIGGSRRETEVNGSPFPGREALLRKVANGRRFVL